MVAMIIKKIEIGNDQCVKEECAYQLSNTPNVFEQTRKHQQKIWNV